MAGGEDVSAHLPFTKPCRSENRPAVRRWVNIAAPDDVVAARRELHAVFDRDRPHDALFEDTWNVDNGSKPHQINFYLTKKSCGAAVADALT